MNVLEMIEKEEGYSERAYYCSEGYPTIGIGWKIGGINQALSDFKYINISREVAQSKLSEIVNCDKLILSKNIGSFALLSEPRQAALLSMSYQLGISGLMKFKNMLSAIERKDWDAAFEEGMDSKWAKQTPQRALRQMNTMKFNDWSQYA